MTHLSELIERVALRHFSDLPILSVYDVKQVNPRDNTCHHTKPVGLWVSDESGDDGWSSWCESEQYGRGALEHRVDLSPNANILHLRSSDDLDDFGVRYGVKPPHHLFCHEPAIQWADVARDFDGILITPYQWSRRLHHGSSWYYGWDCASGCIWRGSAVARIEPVLPPPEAAHALLSLSQDQK